jgi:hypothetical protein
VGAVNASWSSAATLVEQEMPAIGDPYEEHRLSSWACENRNSQVEVDCLLPSGGRGLPVEVKAGKTSWLRSLKLFVAEYRCPLGGRVSHQPLSLFDGILTVPLYAVREMTRWFREASVS